MGKSLTSEGARIQRSTNGAQIACAILVLLLGTAVYVLDRPVGGFFEPVSLSHRFPPIFGRVGDSLPTFAHVFAFSLLTAAWVGGGSRNALIACLTWFGVDSAFEMGQHPQIAQALAERIPGWFEALPILARTDNYFTSGTFDPWDLFSMALGAVTAYLLIRCMKSKDRHNA